MAPKISILIVNYNGGALNASCLRYLDRQTMQDFEVILVNNSPEDTVFKSLALPEYATVLEPGENLGYAGGNNLAAKHASGEWLALLNNDAFPDKDWLELLLKAAENHSDYDFFTSHQVAYDDPTIMDGTGDCYAVNGQPWRRDYRVPVKHANNTSDEVFGFCGAAALIRRDDFNDVGGFDENFFCHVEDVDLSFRMRLKGKRCLHVSDAIVYHMGSATAGGEFGDFAFYQGLRNSVWTYIKNMPRALLLRYFPAFLLHNIRELIFAYEIGKLRVAFKAKFHACLGLPRVLKQRKHIQAERITDNSTLLNAMEHRYVRSPYQKPFLMEEIHA